MINEARLLQQFLELVKINSPTNNEREIADYLKGKLIALGLSVFEDNVGAKIGGNAGNIFALLPGNISAPRLLFSAHMDCVAPCLNVKPQVYADKITSDQTTILGADDKAGIAPILEALQTIIKQNIPHGDIQIIFTVSEEVSLNGSKNLDPNLLKADLGYVLDSSGRPGTIITKAPSQNKLKFSVRGKTAHAGIDPENGINAISVASKACAKIPVGRIDHETTANIGLISGGWATNIVPNLVEVICETRSLSTEKLKYQTDLMIDIFQTTAVASKTTVDITSENLYSAFTLTESSYVIALAKAATNALNLTPKLTSTGGGSDANYFNTYNVPCAVLGIGMQKVHTNEEFILLEDLYNNAKLICEIIKTAPYL